MLKMLTVPAADDAPLQYLQSYTYLIVGCFSLTTSFVACLLLCMGKNLRKSQPFFIGLAVGDLITSVCYLLIGSLRLEMLSDGTFYNLIKPSQCLKMPFLYLYIFGTEYSTLIGLVMAIDRLTNVVFPVWYKHHWSIAVSRILIICCTFYALFSIGLGVLAILKFGATGNLIKQQCGLVTLLGPLYGPYHYIMCVTVSSFAIVLGIFTFLFNKAKISEMSVRGQSFAVVLDELRIQLRQSLTTLLLNIVAYFLAIVMNVSFMNLSLNLPTFDFASPAGKLATAAYCLSCGLTIFILVASNAEVRDEARIRFGCCKKQHRQEVSGIIQKIGIDRSIRVTPCQ